VHFKPFSVIASITRDWFTVILVLSLPNDVIAGVIVNFVRISAVLKRI
jgi:hypothetical protein